MEKQLDMSLSLDKLLKTVGQLYELKDKQDAKKQEVLHQFYYTLLEQGRLPMANQVISLGLPNTVYVSPEYIKEARKYLTWLMEVEEKETENEPVPRILLLHWPDEMELHLGILFHTGNCNTVEIPSGCYRIGNQKQK